MTSNRISVVFFRTAYDTIGGGSKMLLRLLQGLDKKQFNITLVSQRRDILCQRATDLDIEIEIIPFRGVLDTYDGGLLEMPLHKQAIAGSRLIQYNIEFYRRINTPDILWCGGTRPFVTLLPYAHLTNVTSIWNVGLMHESKGKMKYINSACLQGTNHVFIESIKQAKRQLTDEQYKNYVDKFTVFHKGIDTKKFDPERFNEKNRNQLRVGTAALIIPRKGIEYFIDAAAMVLDERSDVHFPIAGEVARANDEQYKDKLKERIRDHGIEDYVEFLGWVEDMPEYLSTLDVFVLPSYNEGIPGAVREALAMGVPVIATDVGGTSEAVLDGETGFLVEPEDTKQLSEKVSKLLDDSSKRRELGIQGRRQIVEKFSIESYVRDYENFLKTITES